MEALILYFVLFFPGIYSFALPGGESIPFSLLGELGRTLTYTLPSLALLWYLVTDKKGFFPPGRPKLQKADCLSFGFAFPAVVFISVVISLSVSFISRFTDLNPPPMVEGPVTVPGWIVIVFSCLGTGYLEESYFRYYLLSRPENSFGRPVFRIILSTVMFSLCHIYEGPWGVLNAVLAGIVLSVVFLRYRSLHGIAWAHGVYNIFVYAIAAAIAPR